LHTSSNVGGKNVFYFKQNPLKAAWFRDSSGILPIWNLHGVQTKGEFPQF